MKNLPETIAWYQAVEDRRWKQVYHFVELLIIGIAGLAIIAVLFIYGETHRLQQVLSFFVLLISLASLALAPAMLYPQFKRWQIFMISLGLGCGIGVSTIAALFLLQPA